MTRWISSALCTITLVAVLFFLPVWDIRSSAAMPSGSDNTMQEVHIVKRKKSLPAVQKQKIQPKNAPAIHSPSAEPEPETAEEPDEPAETPDDASEADTDENNTNDAASMPGNEDSFSSTQDTKAVSTYKSYALGRIASKKKYPYSARSNGFEGKIRVRIVINPDGTLVQTDILEPSEYEILNNACLTAIKKAAPFKKMKSGMSAMTLTFSMDFSLN